MGTAARTAVRLDLASVQLAAFSEELLEVSGVVRDFYQTATLPS